MDGASDEDSQPAGIKLAHIDASEDMMDGSAGNPLTVGGLVCGRTRQMRIDRCGERSAYEWRGNSPLTFARTRPHANVKHPARRFLERWCKMLLAANGLTAAVNFACGNM